MTQLELQLKEILEKSEWKMTTYGVMHSDTFCVRQYEDVRGRVCRMELENRVTKSMYKTVEIPKILLQSYKEKYYKLLADLSKSQEDELLEVFKF